MEAGEYTIMRAAEDTHWWYAGLHDLILRFVRGEARRAGRPMRLLDAGCGTGRLCELLAEFGEVHGCDMHPLALAATAGRGISRVSQADLMLDDLGKEQFDVITAIDVLYHRAITNERTALANLRRALRPGGCLVVQVAAFEALRGEHDVAVHTRKRYRRDEAVAMLERSKFTVEFASYRLGPLFLPTLVWRAYIRKYVGGPAISDVEPTGRSWRHALLTQYVKMENRLLEAGMKQPVGTSVFAVARK